MIDRTEGNANKWTEQINADLLTLKREAVDANGTTTIA